MERRNFLIALMGLGGAALAASTLPATALTAPAPLPEMPVDLTREPTAAIATEEDLADAKFEDVYHYYYRRRRRRRFRYGYRRRYRRCYYFRRRGSLWRRCYY